MLPYALRNEVQVMERFEDLKASAKNKKLSLEYCKQSKKFKLIVSEQKYFLFDSLEHVSGAIDVIDHVK